jgi:quinoprotein glucose dehydrogenase
MLLNSNREALPKAKSQKPRAALTVLCLAGVALGAQPRSDRIGPDTVARLAVAWTYDTGESTEPFRPGADRPAFEATPVYAANHLYLSTPRGLVIALDAETGAERWRIDLKVRPDANYSDFANRGVTVAGDRIYSATVDARLVCLDRRDGSFCKGFGADGQVDLVAGLRRKPEWRGEYGVTSPPVSYQNLVIVGSSVADNSRVRMSSGEVRAFDAASGALRWTFHPLPENADAGGANTWSRMTVDDASGLVFLPTGSASPDYFGGLRQGDNGHANAVVALHAATGVVAWSFQTVHHDLWDYDVASPPLLFPGKGGPAVAVGSKTGHLFLFERATGRPLFPIRERPVPRSDVPGEAAAATQPFPERPPSLVPQQIGEQDIWGATPQDREACLATFRTLRNDGIFTPPSVRGSINVPGNIGGLHWGGMAWDAANRLIIAPVNRLPAIIRLLPRADYDRERKANPKQEITEQAGAPFSMSRQFLLAPSGIPCVAPPWGELVAVHADTGEIAWRSTLGDLRLALGVASMPPTGSPNLGGAAITPTGLLFIGAAMDPHLRAFDTKSGRQVWEGQLPTSARATPLFFTTASGRDMVAVAAGGHDTPFSKPGTTLVVFGVAKP